MSRAFNGSNQYVEHNAALLTSLPITIAGWFYPTAAVNGAVCAIGASGSGAGRWIYLSAASTRRILAWVRQDSGVDVSTTAGTTDQYPLNSWNHAAGVFSGTSGVSTAIAAYQNGTLVDSTTTTFTTPTTLDRTSIGRLVRTSPLHFFPGNLAEIAIWNAALTADEIALLARGCPPAYIRRNSLVSYPPLPGDTNPEYDVVNRSVVWTVTGATKAEHVGMVPSLMRRQGLWKLSQRLRGGM